MKNLSVTCLANNLSEKKKAVCLNCNKSQMNFKPCIINSRDKWTNKQIPNDSNYSIKFHDNASFIAQISSFENVPKRDAILAPVAKQWIVYNYPRKGRWIVVGDIYRDAKRRGIYQALWTDPEGDSCFSIYQISWIKIKKKLFVNKRHHLVSSGGSRGGARGARPPPYS